MRILKASLLVAFCFGLPATLAQKPNQKAVPPPAPQTTPAGPMIDSQTGNAILCKAQQVPEGYTVAGEIFWEQCGGSAWIVKRKRTPAPSSLNPFDGLKAHSSGSPLSIVEPNEPIAAGQCDSFQQMVKRTYNFDPAQVSGAQRTMQSERLDSFWNQVRQSRTTLVPCLRKALKEDSSGSFFAIDGSMLLLELDPSDASKALQVKEFTEANLDGVDLEYWVRTMARRGVEGFDTSEAGAKWLSYPKAKYNLSLHGGYPIDSFLGAVFIFGSMDEELATPVLLRIANQVSHPHRDDAIAILSSLATPASFSALKQVNTAGLSARDHQSIREAIENPKLLKPRAHPKLTREENLRAFQGIINGDYSAFREMVMKAPDGELDAIATLLPEDIPVLRRARRASISRCNQHAISDYASFTAILMALNWKPGQ